MTDDETVDEILAQEFDPDSLARFRYGDTILFEHLHKVLPDFVPNHVERQTIIDELRDQIILPVEDSTKQLHSLHTIVKNCRVCKDVVPNPKLPSWNLVDPSIVFVTEKPLNGSETVFFSLLKELNFSSADCAATSVTRCEPEGKKASADTVNNCASRYLFTELEMMKPNLIVTMGSVASSALLRQKVMIEKSMGEINWIGPWAILVTCSPYYAEYSEAKTDDFAQTLKKAHRFVYG